MATTYVSPQVQAGLVRGNWRGSDFTVYGRLVPGSAALNDIYQLCLIPNGCMITDVAIDIGATGLDTGTALVWSLGDPSSTARFITGATTGRSSAGGIVFPNVGGTYGFQYPLAQGGQFAGGNAGATILQMKITTAATTFVASTPVVAVIQMYIDPQVGGFT
jgi:hypothetical protein